MAVKNYFGNINKDLLDWIPLTAARVLELGCGEGALAEEYKCRNPAVHYTAVEIDPPSAAKARDRVDRLIEGNFENMADQEFGDTGQFDAIIMGDVLEHLVDPWRALARIERFLTSAGAFICCVPNIAHWSALVELMHGRWPYRDSGLFDRTHLHFFTLDSLKRMLTESGFHVLKMRPRNVPLDKASAEVEIPRLADLASSMGIDRNSFISRSNALQYVLVCKKKGVSFSPMRVHVAAMAPRFLEVRARLPAEYLQSSAELVTTLTEKNMRLPNVSAALPKIVILQRMNLLAEHQHEWVNWIKDARRKGWVIVQEIDDHPDLLAEVYGQNTQQRQEQMWHILSSSHAVQTSTVQLAHVFKAHNPETIMFDNAMFRIEPFRQRRPETVRVFFGALNREKFSVKIAQALNPLLARNGSIQFVVVHDKAFFENIETDRKEFHPALPYDAYLHTMASCDVALLPLEGSHGESFKSDIKFLEASSRSVVSAGSAAVYGRTIVHNETGLIVPNLADWPDALSRLIDDADLRARLAGNAWAYVSDRRMFAHQVQARENWYRSLWLRRYELDAALVGRHPELEPQNDEWLAE